MQEQLYIMLLKNSTYGKILLFHPSVGTGRNGRL
jgi:hypothetical protein